MASTRGATSAPDRLRGARVGPSATAVTGAAAGQAVTVEVEALLRRLESQLRRHLLDPSLTTELGVGGRNWAERLGTLAPDLRPGALEVASALAGATGAERSEAISGAMRLLARLRTQAPGVAAPAESSRLAARPAADGRPVGAPNGPPRRLSSVVPKRGAAPAPATPVATAPRPRSRASKAVDAPPAKPALLKSRGAPAGGGLLSLDTTVEALPRFKKPYTAALQKLGLRTLRHLLYHFPRRHQDYSTLLPIAQLRPGEEVTIEARVLACQAIGPYHRRPGRRVEATLADATGTVKAVWFGQEWRAKQLQPGMSLFVSGKVEAFGGRLQFTHPDYEKVGDEEAIHTGRLVPHYPLSGDLPGSWLRARIKWVVDELAHTVEDPLPDALRQRWDLPPLHAALQQMHFPDDEQELAAARRRIAFDDLLALQLGLLQYKREWQQLAAIPLVLPAAALAAYVERLPFALTAAQQRALAEVLADLARDYPMGRLLQGDVGSGKTVVAALAALAAVDGGCQAAIVAPTEILAEQHARTLAGFFAAIRPMLKPVLITGSLTSRARAEAWKLVAGGQAPVVVGTHALFSERGDFARLALVVVDEQHRFGVYQRDTLWRKGERPHLLAMTATPIPRTLALQKYGDLDLSVIDALPAGRVVTKTRYAMPGKRDAVYAFVRGQVQAGRQAYIICPLVEESAALAVKSVTAEFSRLQAEVFPDLRLGLLHGRMQVNAKDEAMRRFRDQEIDILVATTVIEVGVDVPNATVILVEGAERFGLAQLHQLRGRVGRGAHQSYCILMASDSVDEKGERRLRLVESTTDGFALAEADLQERKTGTFFGSEQSGDERLLRWAAFADLAEVRRAAQALLADDPGLTRPEHALLARRVARVRAQQTGQELASADTEAGADLVYV